MFRQNSVGNESPASKFVEVLARANIPVHLSEEISSGGDAAFGQAERTVTSLQCKGCHSERYQEISQQNHEHVASNYAHIYDKLNVSLVVKVLSVSGL